MPEEMSEASLFCWLILVVVWSRVLCSEVYLAGSVNTHICICEVSCLTDKGTVLAERIQEKVL